MDATDLINRANDELGAAAALMNSYPVQAMELMASSIGTALRSACMSEGFDFGRGFDPMSMIGQVPRGAWQRTVQMDVATLLASVHAFSSASGAGDFRAALERDMETAAAFLCDVEDHLRVEPALRAAFG